MHIHGSPRKSVATRHHCTEQALGHLREGCFCFDDLPVRRRHTGCYRRQTVHFILLTRPLTDRPDALGASEKKRRDLWSRLSSDTAQLRHYRATDVRNQRRRAAAEGANASIKRVPFWTKLLA